MTNKDLSSNLFDGVVLPDGANDCGIVYFKIAACSTATIAANGSFPGATGGEAAINDIIISGTSVSGAIPTLAAPTASIPAAAKSTETPPFHFPAAHLIPLRLNIKSTAARQRITQANLFRLKIYRTKLSQSKPGQNKAVIRQAKRQYIHTQAQKMKSHQFDFTDGKYPEYVNGAVTADSGVYPAGRITASLDGESQYTPLYSTDEKAISIAP